MGVRDESSSTGAQVAVSRLPVRSDVGRRAGRSMSPREPEPRPPSGPMLLGDHFRDLVDAFSELISRHILLARVELKEDAKAIGVEVGRIVAFFPLLLVGYVLVAVAASLFLTRYFAPDVAFLAVGLFHLAVGAAGVSLALRKLQTRELMNDTAAELDTTVASLRTER